MAIPRRPCLDPSQAPGAAEGPSPAQQAPPAPLLQAPADGASSPGPPSPAPCCPQCLRPSVPRALVPSCLRTAGPQKHVSSLTPDPSPAPRASVACGDLVQTHHQRPGCSSQCGMPLSSLTDVFYHFLNKLL